MCLHQLLLLLLCAVLTPAAALHRWSATWHSTMGRPPLGSAFLHAGLPVVNACVREGSGTTYCTKVRRRGRTPAVLFSLPDQKFLLLDLETKEAEAHVSPHLLDVWGLGARPVSNTMCPY
jgi:hypothetical protein